ncbi:MAG: hypothetical protein WAM82_07730 [Thermoanaerobaculia bacterium]
MIEGTIVERLATFVSSLSGQVDVDSERDLQRLAAYLFAVATLLQKSFWNATWDEPFEPGRPRLAPALAQLQDLRPQTPPREIYRFLISTLVAIEDRLAKPPDIERSQLRPNPCWIPLDREDGRQLDLVGRVALWLRPPSLARRVWQHARQTQQDRSHPPVRPRPPAAELERLGLYWGGDQLPEARPVPRSRRLSSFDDIWPYRGGSFPLKVALCPLTARSGPVFDIDAKGQEFAACRPDGLRERTEIEQHLTELFAEGAREGVNLFVLPELSIDPPARQFLASLVRQYPRDLLGVVGGSFHIWKEDGPATEGASGEVEPHRPANEAVFLDGGGEVVWRQEKRGHFTISREKVEEYPHFFRSRPDMLPHPEITEGIRRGNSLGVLDTRIGRLCLLICADAVDLDCDYREVVRRIRPDFLFIISLSPESARFESFARELKDLAIGTLYINSACACPPGEELAIVDLAFWAEETTPPTQIKWRAGGRPMRYDFSAHRWRPSRRETGVFLLRRSRALVLDLGAFYRRWIEPADLAEQ